jgi:hypothetical protein
VRERLERASGRDFAGIRIHDDQDANRAADRMNARAFTIGNHIYFGKNQYQPTTTSGVHLIAHEAAHSVQQGRHASTVSAHARTTATVNPEEQEATHLARSVAKGHASTQPLTTSTSTDRIPRAISFTHANNRFTTNAMAKNESATGFSVQSDPAPSF